MMKRSRPPLITMSLLLLVSSFSGCSLKAVIAENGFMPLEEFDMIQIVSKDGILNKNQTLLGRTMKWNGLKNHLIGPKTLLPGVEAFSAPIVPFEQRLLPGPEEVLRKASGSADVTTSFKINSWGLAPNVRMGGESNIILNNIWRGFLTFNEDAEVNYFADKQPPGAGEAPEKFLLITDFIAADVVIALI